MAIINKNLTTQQYTDQHKPILIDWNKRSFDFQEDYVVSVDKDMNSQLLEFLSAPEYDGVDLYGTNVYVNYLTEWSLDGEHISQGSILLDTSLANSQLKIKWLLNQLQTYKPGKVNFDLTFQIEQEFNSQYYVSWKDSTNQDFALNTWFYIINPTAQKASWILAVVNDINEFEKVKNSVAGNVQTCITIGDNTTDVLYDKVDTQPANWTETYKLYYKKSGSTYVLNDSADFDSTNCYLRKYVGLAYKPAYVLKTLPGKFEVAEGVNAQSDMVFPLSPEGQIDFSNYTTAEEVENKIDSLKSEITDGSVVAKKAQQLDNQRLIRISGGATSNGIGFNGTQDISIPIDQTYESYLAWGGKDLSDKLSPIDVSQKHLNRFAFAKPEGITVEYSRDGGTTWIDYGQTDNNKTSIFTETTTSALPYYIGKKIPPLTSENAITTNDKLRITLNATSANIYTRLRKLLMNVSTNGATGCKVLIQASTIGNPTTYESLGTHTLSGWSGWNSISFAGTTGRSQLVFGGASSQTSQFGILRFTFSISGIGSSTGAFSIQNILGLGDISWKGNTAIYNYGRLYDIDLNKKATFPGDVEATKFKGDGSQLTNLQSANVSGLDTKIKTVVNPLLDVLTKTTSTTTPTGSTTLSSKTISLSYSADSGNTTGSLFRSDAFILPEFTLPALSEGSNRSLIISININISGSYVNASFAMGSSTNTSIKSIQYITVSGKMVEISCSPTIAPSGTYRPYIEFTLEEYGEVSFTCTSTVGYYCNYPLMLDVAHPIDSVYMTYGAESPASVFHGGVWKQLKNTFLYATANNSAGTTGGEATHTLTIGELPDHNHPIAGERTAAPAGADFGPWSAQTTANAGESGGRFFGVPSGNTGGSQPHNNMPPYTEVHMWRRVL